LVGWLEFNVPFQHKYGYIRDAKSIVTPAYITQVHVVETEVASL